MKKTLLFKFVVLVFAFVGLIFSANAQVTTSTMSGVIRESKGALPGASVRATHVPTGTVYTTTTSADGRFTIPNMRSGGPYTVEVTFIGYQAFKSEGIFLKLGDSYAFNAKLNDGGTQLEEVVVAGKADKTFNSKRIGAATNISKEQLEKLPTLSRSIQDFTRLTPQANGNSFAGTNNRYNSISIDGAVNNDVFGLAANGAPGGQAGTQPISLDAIQEIQVVLSPYDVANGNFAGGGINAVTRSGTNRVEGSAYYLNRNENLTGKKVGASNTKAGDFSNSTYGFRIGAPIIKNKLFFFVSAEKTKITTPTTFNAGEAGSVLSVADANTILNTLRTRYNYEGGAIDAINAETKSDKIFARIDWNINSKNQLTLRHNYIKASDDNISRSGTSFRFGNNAYTINNEQNNSVLELRSQISEKLSNNLIIGYQRVRDFREPVGQLFPQIRINGFSGGASVAVGSEASSTANSLDQDVFEFTDNLKIFAGKHTFTVGTHNEFFKFKNVFLNNFAGSYSYNNLADFLGGTARPNTAAATYSITPGDTKPAAAFDAAQLGFYFQDEIEAFTGFKLTAGLRADVPMIFDNPPANPLVASAFPGNRTDQTPQRRILVSPRVGFNWDLTGTRSMQLRGGFALLTSRAPFVWLSNGFSFNGVTTAAVNATNNTGTFIPDPNNQQAAGGALTTYEVNLTNKNLKLPQLWRSNIALDVKLPGGVLATLEAIYSKKVNDIIYSNINLKPSTATIPAGLTGGNDNRALFAYPTNKVNSTFTNAYYLDNTSKGSSYNLTAELKKGFDFGLYSTIAYTYGQSHDVNSGTSSTAASNTNFVQTISGPNNAPLAVSNFDIRHRIVGSLNYSIYYGKQKSSGTTLSLVYVGKSGTPFTYLYFGDLNQDGANQNDLLYVPRNLSEIRLAPLAASGTLPALTVAEQWADLNAFIEADPYLSKRRGQYTDRNGARMPWEHQFDFRIMQDIGTIFKGSKNTLQITFDIINIGNLLNKDWGHLYSLSNTASTLINYNYSATTGGNYTFRKPTTGTAYSVSPFASRWQGQLGVRYIFN